MPYKLDQPSTVWSGEEEYQKIFRHRLVYEYVLLKHGHFKTLKIKDLAIIWDIKPRELKELIEKHVTVKETAKALLTDESYKKRWGS